MTAKITLPYVSSPTLISKILEKVKEAKAPERFTQDFLATKLGFKGGNYRAFIPLGKKISLLNSDGTPTDLYKSYRNPSKSKAAMAVAIKKGFHEFFERNEFAGNLDKEKIKGMVVEITGLEPSDRIVQLICQTFDVLRAEANFEEKLDTKSEDREPSPEDDKPPNPDLNPENNPPFDLRLGYTINLVLPKTDDPAVFNAIFKSLKENLLRK